MRFEHTVTIDAPAETVWAVYSDVERWPDWTASVTSVTFVAGDTLAPGARARIKQPKLARADWEVTALEPGRTWTWVATVPGLRSTAVHDVLPRPDGGTDVRMTLDQAGPLGWVIARLYGRLTRQYLEMEGAGLKQRSEARARA